ncbi:hypothetical protein CROQUDRAFT_90123 [Cronartium quercuum f. sp. fusiforme G11]|uniref:Uncharacterized protein n=1 Tax=Cronartium quercuum f. sp. fusiforme G11 TaxID=708437 RepID=A0A9P6NS85_9BASI|nr:hypothetical protein CROQUDRAFT_90123 [Cronartium quercuum f. sp. fusiforme G11]
MEACQKFCQEQARVMEILENSVDSENRQWIGTTSDLKVAFDNLCAQHDSSNGVLTALIISQITTARLQLGQTLSNFLNHVQGLHNTYFDYISSDPEMKISSKILAIFLLNSLPDRYELITQHFLSNLLTLKCADVFTHLHMEATRTSGPESANVYLSRTLSTTKPSHHRQRLAVGKNSKDHCHLPFHAHLNHTNSDCHCQALGIPISDKPSTSKNHNTMTDTQKARKFDELKAAKQKESAHFTIEEEVSAYFT